MRIGKPAKNHEIQDVDIFHALRHVLADFPDLSGVHESPMTMYVGPATDGTLLEVGVIYPVDEPEGVVLHAMGHRAEKYPLPPNPQR